MLASSSGLFCVSFGFGGVSMMDTSFFFLRFFLMFFCFASLFCALFCVLCGDFSDCCFKLFLRDEIDGVPEA